MSQNQQWKLVQYEGNMPKAYDELLVPALFGPWARKLIDFATVESGERVLDLACGTGVVSRLIAQKVGETGKIVGLDVNRAMLDVARQSAKELTTAIEWREGSALAMPFPDASFDVVLCQAGLMFFAEPQAMREMYRVLASDGRLAFSFWRPIQYSPGWMAMVGAFERHGSDEAAAMMRSPFSLGGDTKKVRDLIISGGFSGVHFRLEAEMIRFPSAKEFLGVQAAASPIGSFVNQLDDPKLNALIEDIRFSMQSYMDDDGLAFPVEAYLVSAYK